MSQDMGGLRQNTVDLKRMGMGHCTNRMEVAHREVRSVRHNQPPLPSR